MFLMSQAPTFNPFNTASFPLSPLNPNSLRSRHTMSKLNGTSFNNASSFCNATRSQSTSIRGSKFATLKPKSSEERRVKSRGLFFQSLSEKREAKRFEVRGDQAERREFLEEQRDMAAENERRARLELGYIEEADELYELGEEEDSSQDEIPAEDFEQQEDQELEAMVSMMDDVEEKEMTDYGSDEDGEYEKLMMEALLETEKTAQMVSSSQVHRIDHDMDYTMD